MLFPTILAGGTGTRLWPASRTAMPKQFIEFFPGQGTLLEATLGRLHGMLALGSPIVVCGEEQRFLVAETLRRVEADSPCVLLEPEGRNTAPAIALAAQLALEMDEEAQLLVLPADHVIANVQRFQQAVSEGSQLAADDWLVTFGIVPGIPETGYGYVKMGEVIADSNACQVAEFVEKPDLERAQSYLASGDYRWNSGMFLFKAEVYLEELAAHAADIEQCCRSAYAGLERGDDFIRIPSADFSSCRSESIDYAVMEKTNRAAMLSLDAGWTDLGAWNAVWEQGDKDEAGNVVSGDVLAEATSNSFIHANSRLVAALGIDDVVIVETPDAVLVADKAQSQDVKLLVEKLQLQNRSEKESHTLVHRPWGSFESLFRGEGYQVKRIVVNPGEALSLQRHQHRAEHWIGIAGSPLVHCDGKEFALEVNESTFIPLGSKHRLTNPGDTPAEIIEVQVGSYLGEDDIERFEDRYGR